jgi:hypothetical protein
MMTGGASDSRHPEWAWVKGEIRSGHPVRISLPGSPYTEVFVDPDGARLGLRLQTSPGEKQPAVPFASIDIRQVADGGRRLLELSTDRSSLFQDFLQFAAVVADRVQLDGVPAGIAVSGTAHAWASLVRRRKTLSREQELGLLGELTVLEALAASLGWEQAVRSWKGPLGEEHDFGLSESDLEVKCTGGERRVHTISPLSQLTATPGRALWLVSVQFTRGGSGGVRLGELLQSIHDEITRKAPSCLGEWKDRLLTLDIPELPPAFMDAGDRWHLRTAPLCLRVDDTFPRLRGDLLDGLPHGTAQRISDLSYRLNVSDLVASTPLLPALSALASYPNFRIQESR